MIQTFEAVIDKNGNIHLLQEIKLSASKRALVTILDEEPVTSISETALLSEVSLAQDWQKSEEEEAWQHLQPVQ